MEKYLVIEIQCDPGSDRPSQIIIGREPGKKIESILECWYDTGCWWEGESEKLFYRIYCQDGGMREIFKDLSSGEWFLYRIYD